MSHNDTVNASEPMVEGQRTPTMGRLLIDHATGRIRELTVDVPGAPVGKGRPRASATPAGVRMHTPAKTQRYEGLVAQCVWAARGQALPPDGSATVILWAVFPRPKRLRRKKDPPGRLSCSAKPDADNVAKAVLDGLVAGGALVDDARVAALHVLKLYEALDETPHCRITIRY